MRWRLKMVSGDILPPIRLTVPLDDIQTRARSTLRITVLNVAYGLAVQSSAIAVERPLLPALASSGKDCQPPPEALYRRLAPRQQSLNNAPSSLIGRAISQ